MVITKIIRSYSRSVNAKYFSPIEQQAAKPDSWVKIESVYEATLESADNVEQTSQEIYGMCKADVAKGVSDLKNSILGIKPMVATLNASEPAPLNGLPKKL